MKEIILSAITVFFVLFSCSQTVSDTARRSSYCLSQSEAENILGQPAVLIDHSSETKKNVVRHRCTYAASANSTTDRSSNLYFLLEQYPDSLSAKRAYADLVSSNQNMPGQKKINDIGNEALLQTDGNNFDLITFRIKDKLLVIKINKITVTTSLKELQNISQKMALRL